MSRAGESAKVEGRVFLSVVKGVGMRNLITIKKAGGEFRDLKGETFILESLEEELKTSTEMRVSKVIETKVYGAIYTVALPIRFFFNKDGSYDGLDVHVKGASERDQELIKELMIKLVEAGEKEHE